MYQDHGGKSTKWSSKDGFNCECKLHVIGKRGHYFIKTCNKPYPLEFEIRTIQLLKVVVKMMTSWIMDYSSANRPKRLAAEVY